MVTVCMVLPYSQQEEGGECVGTATTKSCPEGAQVRGPLAAHGVLSLRAATLSPTRPALSLHWQQRDRCPADGKGGRGNFTWIEPQSQEGPFNGLPLSHLFGLRTHLPFQRTMEEGFQHWAKAAGQSCVRDQGSPAGFGHPKRPWRTSHGYLRTSPLFPSEMYSHVHWPEDAGLSFMSPLLCSPNPNILLTAPSPAMSLTEGYSICSSGRQTIRTRPLQKEGNLEALHEMVMCFKEIWD